MSSQPTGELETFANPAADCDYTIRMQIPEFTCLCPRTGQPDFATLDLEYVPDRLCVELKSLKLYVWSFRDRGVFHEAVTNEMASHLDATCAAASPPPLSPSADSAAGRLCRRLRCPRPAAALRRGPEGPADTRGGLEKAGFAGPVQAGGRRYNRAFFMRLRRILRSD
jgi:7-cyano-7-deazaguanine reductase